MEMKDCKKFIFLILAAPFLLSGCATQTIPLAPGAENVKVVDASTYPLVLSPLVCHLKGQIFSSDDTPLRKNNADFTESELNLIKNKALLLNANLVVIHKNTVVDEGNHYNHISISDAYQCYPFYTASDITENNMTSSLQ